MFSFLLQILSYQTLYFPLLVFLTDLEINVAFMLGIYKHLLGLQHHYHQSKYPKHKKYNADELPFHSGDNGTDSAFRFKCATLSKVKSCYMCVTEAEFDSKVRPVIVAAKLEGNFFCFVLFF